MKQNSFSDLILFLFLFLIILGFFYFLNKNINKSPIENFITPSLPVSEAYDVPYNIFFYWNDVNNSPIMKHFINHIYRKFQNTPWKVFFVSKKNLSQFVSPSFLQKYGQLNSVRFSDFLRLQLLYDYGGVWIDASTVIIDPTFLDNFRIKLMKYKCDVLLFEFKEHTIDPKFPYLENWFFMAPKHSIFINDLKNYFDQAFSMGFYNFKRNILMKSSLDLSNTIKYGKSTYHMQHALIHYMLLKHPFKYHLCIENASKSMFKAQNHVSWNHKELINFIIKNSDWKDYYAIKMISHNRKAIQGPFIEPFIHFLKTI
jgi:hypothetical protein